MKKNKNSEDFVIQNGILQKYKGSGGAVVIPDAVTSIGNDAFWSCESLTSVIIPDSMISIRDRAFSNCSNLTSITIPYGVTKIGNYAFSGCSNLTFATIPESVTSIGNCAFWNCSNLTSVTIPENVTSIGNFAFSNCSNLASVIYRGVIISTKSQNDVNWTEILEMLINRNFSIKMNHDVKYSMIWSLFIHNPEDESILSYIQKNFAKMFKYLIDHDDAETITSIISSEKFLTKRNVDKYITHAIDNRHIEIQVLLMNYKADKIGYSDPFKKLKL